jgi:hypothetical protein
MKGRQTSTTYHFISSIVRLYRSELISSIQTIEQLCTFLRNQVIQGLDPIESVNTVGEILEDVEVNQNTISSITSCVLRAVV